MAYAQVVIDVYNVTTDENVEAWDYLTYYDPTNDEDEHDASLESLYNARKQLPAGCDAAVRSTVPTLRTPECTCNECGGCPGGWCHDCTPDIEAGHSKSCPVRKEQQ